LRRRRRRPILAILSPNSRRRGRAFLPPNPRRHGRAFLPPNPCRRGRAIRVVPPPGQGLVLSFPAPPPPGQGFLHSQHRCHRFLHPPILAEGRRRLVIVAVAGRRSLLLGRTPKFQCRY
jgi:hypothetical protein